MYLGRARVRGRGRVRVTLTLALTLALTLPFHLAARAEGQMLWWHGCAMSTTQLAPSDCTRSTWVGVGLGLG